LLSALGVGVAAEGVYDALTRVWRWATPDRWQEADELTRLLWLLAGRFEDELPGFTRKQLERSWRNDPTFLAVYERLSVGDDPKHEHGALVAAIEPLVESTKTETAHDVAERVADFLPYLLPETKKDFGRVLFELRQVTNLLETQHEEVTSGLAEIKSALPSPDRLERHIDLSSRCLVSRAERDVVGRDWVFERLDEFARRDANGYMHIVAAAGLGKTALAAAIALRYAAPAFFIDALAGRSRPDQCLNHLSAELVERFTLPYQRLPERAGEDSGFLSQLLEEATARTPGHDIWLVVDGVDEAERLRTDANSVLLPPYLPRDVRVVLTHRPGDYVLSVDPGVGQEELEIRADDPRQTTDIHTYLSREAGNDAGTNRTRERQSAVNG
jgi:hypothetical protein